MSTHIKSDIDAYLAATLPESRRRDVDSHIQECDACRKALHRERTRRAHLNREALKKASANWMPNLFLHRQARQGLPAGWSGAPSTPSFRWGRAAAFTLLAGMAAFYFRAPLKRLLLDWRPTPSPEAAAAPAATLPVARPKPVSPETPVVPSPEPAAVSTPTVRHPRRAATPVLPSTSGSTAPQPAVKLAPGVPLSSAPVSVTPVSQNPTGEPTHEPPAQP